MASAYLPSKLSPPTPVQRVKRVARPRLHNALDDCLHHPLTLISAPAGYGKTVLVAEWVQHNPTIWLTLDADDNDPAQFFAYVVAAFDQVGIHLSTNGSDSPKAFLTALIPQLDAALDSDRVFVLDNYHVIADPKIHTFIETLIEHLPAPLHLILITRTDPPLPIPRWRAYGQLVEIRAEDLRFTVEETSAYFGGSPTEQASAVQQMTEGWITGIQLAAIAKTEHTTLPTITGDHRHVSDYLIDEVFRQQPPDIRAFLLDTAILDHLSEPLCRAVTGRTDCQAVLEYLERLNAFVVPLDDRRHAYRYHSLFADFLRTRSQRTSPKRIPLLHRRAAAWYERSGQIDPAVEHLLLAGDVTSAAQLIRSIFGIMAHSLPDRARAFRVANWLEHIPNDLLITYPDLCLLHAWALVYSGQTDRFELIMERLRQAERGLMRTGAFNADVLAAVRALMSRLSGDMPHTLAFSEGALQSLQTPQIGDSELRGTLSLSLGEAHWLSGDLIMADRLLNEVSAQDQGRSVVALLAACQAGHLQVAQGQHTRAIRTFRQALRLVDRATDPSVISLIHAGISAVLLEWNDLGAAAHHAAESMRLSSGHVQVVSHITTAQVQQARGDLDAALHSADQAVYASASLPKRIHAHALAYKTRLHIARGELSEAAQWAHTHEPEQPFEQFTYARILIAQRRFAEATTYLDGLSVQNPIDTAERLILQARVLEELGSEAQAVETIERAVELAQPEGYVRIFREVLPLLRRVPRAANILTSLEPQASAPQVSLSEREIEVLRLVAAGLSNSEIADTIIVSLETVKWHVKNIYRKLNVSSRTQALARMKDWL
jgi:LuxR family transcriptional regulator, maltose regulon positive regulatory protein